jgi:hypothetical protein
VNFVKFSEIDNTVNSLDVHVEFGKHSAHLEKRLGLVADGGCVRLARTRNFQS